jgi:hypothetical protein
LACHNEVEACAHFGVASATLYRVGAGVSVLAGNLRQIEERLP